MTQNPEESRSPNPMAGKECGRNDHSAQPGQKRCPVCRTPMRAEVERGVAIDLCPDHGIWIDQDKLASFCTYLRTGQPEETNKAEPAEAPATPQGDTGLQCPACGYNLTSLTSSTCPECGQPFMVAKVGMPPPPDPKALVILSSSMICPVCSYSNLSFMPKECAKCGRRFSLWERIFGIKSPKKQR